MKHAQEQQSTTQENAFPTDKASLHLPIDGTPFVIKKWAEDPRFFVTFGLNILAEADSEQEAILLVEERDWSLLLALIMLVTKETPNLVQLVEEKKLVDKIHLDSVAPLGEKVPDKQSRHNEDRRFD